MNLGATDYEKNGQNLKTEIDIIDTKTDEPEDDTDIIEDDVQYGKSDSEFDEEEQNTGEKEHLQDIEIEARYIAEKIEKLLKEKYQVYDRKSKKFRDIRPKDIVILLRSTKNKANIYEQELVKKNLPVFSDSTQEYLDTIEIETIMSLLKIIDNPIQDIPLVTILRSPIAGFSDDELVKN